jgi:sulfite exporter TauE/SafE
MKLLDSLNGVQPGATFISILLAALCWGLAGGFSHCIGMCGLFVLTAGKIDDSRWSVRLARQLLFQFGRGLSLAAIGIAAGWLGSLTLFASHFAKLQGYIAISFGILIALLSLGYVGIIPWLKIPEPDIMAAGGGVGRKLFGSAMRSTSWHQPLALGIVVGFLPCMLTYTVALTAAATTNLWYGAGVLLVFWLGTIPGLLMLGMLGHAAQKIVNAAQFRIMMTRLGGAILFVTGLYMAWRGWSSLG